MAEARLRRRPIPNILSGMPGRLPCRTSLAVAFMLSSPGANAAESAFVVGATAGLSRDPTLKSLISLGLSAGAQYGVAHVEAMIEENSNFFDHSEFYGLGLGPVYDDVAVRVSLLGGLGLLHYQTATCCENLVAHDTLAYRGRAAFTWRVAESRQGTRTHLGAYLTATYGPRAHVEQQIDGARYERDFGGLALAAHAGLTVTFPL